MPAFLKLLINMHITLTARSIEWLKDNHIYFDWSRGESRLHEGGGLTFEDETEVEPFVGFYSGGHVSPMGAFSYSWSSLPMALGRYCSVAAGVRVAGGRHPIECLSSSNFTYDRSINNIADFLSLHDADYTNFVPNPQKSLPNIGHDVWIGEGTVLMRGITVGHGAVIAANSIVTKDIRPYDIVGGNPARLIKRRFDDKTISLLLESEWWNYKFTDFKGFDISDPREFATQFLERKPDIVQFAPNKIRMADISHDHEELSI